MDDRYCIILIHEFPYYNGETFFDSELKFLSKKFDKIFIFSILGKADATFDREIPSNVTIVPLGVSNNVFKNIIKGINPRYIKKEKQQDKKIKYKLYSLFSRGKLNGSFKKIKRWLSEHENVFSNKNVVVYSYWLNLSYLCSFIKEYLQKITTTIKTISRAHGYDIYSERMSFSYLPYQLEGIESCDSIHACSQKGANYLRKKYPEHREKIFYDYLGVEQEKIMSIHNQKVFATCSVIRPIKQIDLFAEAFCLFVKNNPDYKWICIGGGPDYKKIHSIVKNNKCLGKVKFTNALPNKDVINCLISNNVGYFFNVSKDEGLPVTLMEAQSLGIPCIATNVGGSSEIVNNENGLLIDPVNASFDILEAMNAIKIFDSNKYLRISNNSFKNWNKAFNAKINFTKWANNLSNFG